MLAHVEDIRVGVNKMVERPMIRSGLVMVRKMMNLSSSFEIERGAVLEDVAAGTIDAHPTFGEAVQEEKLHCALWDMHCMFNYLTSLSKARSRLTNPVSWSISCAWNIHSLCMLKNHVFAAYIYCEIKKYSNKTA